MKNAHPALEKRRLGRTELQVTRIGLGGAWLMGRNGDQPLTSGAEIVQYALAQGINYVDTAECYGESELAVGMALEGYEGDCVLATKFGHIPEAFDFSREAVLESVERSRKRLRYRPIDLLQLHTPPEPLWESLWGENGAIAGMKEAQERGWCRWLGTTGRDVEFLRRCVETDVFDTLLVFLRYDLMDVTATTLLQEAKSHDMGVFLASPLRMGLFGSAREESLPYLTPEEQIQLKQLDTLFEGEEGGICAGALRFACACPYADVVLSGAGSKEEVQSVLEVTATPLTASLETAVLEIARRG
jgi:aryl-alcohol dehydrogenase-like predicted oxidoreductase